MSQGLEKAPRGIWLLTPSQVYTAVVERGANPNEAEREREKEQDWRTPN